MTSRRLLDTFTPNNYDLSLTIDRPNRKFSGIITITGRAVNDSSISLHAKELVIESCSVNGSTASFNGAENDELIVSADFAGGDELQIVLSYSGTITDHMHGMYPCYFTHDGVKKELIATQFESHHAREVFPCVDEPSAKATFDVTLTTETGITVLGNMPVKNQTTENDILVTSFNRTPVMSPYLLAWVYGDLQSYSTKTKRGIDVNIWATTAQTTASLEFAADFAARTIDYFEEYFGIEYPLPKSDHVALPDFSSGAMENWGLITYREIALLADPATSSVDTKHYVATVIAHELSHQWFGNLVTMKWWDNLWLNESFADFIENLPIDAMHPDWDIWMEYVLARGVIAMRRDALDGVQAVQVDVNHPDEISSLFDGAIVYGKGGRLIGMLREYVGEDAFKRGLHDYFTKFQYKNTSGEDLWDCLEASSGKPVRDFMNQWVLRPGYPIVHVQPDGLRQEQFFIGDHEPSDKIWTIPLAPSTDDIPQVLDTDHLDIQISHKTRLNVGSWSHFITNYTDEHFAALLQDFASLQPLDRLQLINERVLLTRSGHTTNASLIPLLRASKDETNESVWSILHVALGELKKFVEFDDEAREYLKQLALDVSETQFKRLGWDGPENESENDIKLRPIILAMRIFGKDQAVISEAASRYKGPGELDSLDPELRGIILAGKVSAGLTDDELNELLDASVSTSASVIREDIVGALTGSDNQSHLQRLIACISDPEVVRPQDATHWFVYLIRNRHSKTATWQWLRDNWQWVVDTFGGDKSYDDFTRYAATALTTRQQYDEYVQFFTPMKKEPALKRVIELGVSEIKGRVELIEAQQDSVKTALREQKF